MDRRVLLGHYIHFFLRQEIVEPVQLFVTGNNFRREYYRAVWLEIQILMLTFARRAMAARGSPESLSLESVAPTSEDNLNPPWAPGREFSDIRLL